MIPIHVMRACALALVALFTLTPARGEDQLKVAIGQINNWENQAPTLGQDAGIFKRLNLVLENAPISAPASALPASCARSRGARRCAFCCPLSPGPETSIGM